MYRIAVCDDDKFYRDHLKSLLSSWYEDLAVDCFAGGEELLAHYLPYDGIFLDIDMDGLNGIETGKRVRALDKDVKIIYLTAYRDYVAGAFGVHAFQYLLKPVKEKEVRHVLEEVFRYRHEEKEKTVMDFQTVKGLVCLDVDDILYFEYEERTVGIVTGDGKYKMVEKIGAVGKRMEPYGFSMPHQSFVVNMLHVKNVISGQILLDSGLRIPVAQKKQKAWKKELVDYLAGRLEGQNR